MKKILIASDLSERSRPALRRAVLLAKDYGADLTLLHVVDDDQPRTLIDDEVAATTSALRAELQREASGDLAPTVSVVVGDPFRAIADEARRIDADVIVMGSHRKRLLGDIFTGTTVERVMRIGGRPVLMVNRKDDGAYANVLAAVDLSEASAHALRVAQGLGLLDPERDAAVHGFLPLGEGMMYYAGLERDKIDEHVSANASQARSAISSFLRKNGFGAMTRFLLVEKGSAAEAIKVAVGQVQPDLLVIGTRGHGAVKRALLGSVANEVVRQAECDILAVPPADVASGDALSGA